MEKEGKEGTGLPETSTGLGVSGVQLLAPRRHFTFLTLSFISLGGCWEVHWNNAFPPLDRKHQKQEKTLIITGRHQTSSLACLQSSQQNKAPNPPGAPGWCLLGECKTLLSGRLQVLSVVVVRGA